MDQNFKWSTKEEKMSVVRYWWRMQKAICYLCQDRENPMEPYSNAAISPWAATIEHLVPKRDGGPNTVGNVRLAHRVCNNALGALWQQNKDREKQGLDPLPDKWALNSRRGDLGYSKRQLKLKEPYQNKSGTLAAAIENGDVTAHGTYIKPPAKPMPSEPKNRISSVPFHETMWILTGKKVPKRSLLDKRQRCK